MKEHKSIYILIAALCVGVVGLAVGYAALSTQLKISIGTVTSAAQSWHVGFETGTVSATASSTSETGFSCGTATVTDTTVTVANTELSKPGDKCTYHLTVANTGSIAAKLANIVGTHPTGISCTGTGAEMVCGNITYSLTSDATGATLLTTNGVVAANTGKMDVYLVAKYNAEDTVETETTQSSAGFTLTYNQE